MFRVAEFIKKGRKQEFIKFAYKGYKISQNGRVYHYKKKVSQNKKDQNYVCVDFGVNQKDVAGHWIYANDLVYDSVNNVYGIIKYYDNKGAYILRVDAGNIQIPYAILDTRELSLKITGNIYQNEMELNEWKNN